MKLYCPKCGSLRVQVNTKLGECADCKFFGPKSKFSLGDFGERPSRVEIRERRRGMDLTMDAQEARLK